MKRKLVYLLMCLIFLSGLSLLLYPYAANQWNTYRQNRWIKNYDAVIAASLEDGTIDYTVEWQKANAYNLDLLPMVLPDSFAIAQLMQETDRTYITCLNLFEDGMMGYIEIPKINIKIPIYHTTDEEVLQKGAGHLEGSSLPVGGANTHAVISAHRGLPSASLFTDLDRMTIGDHFVIYMLDGKLCYEVDQIKIVDPTQTDDLAVNDGEDLVTLLTCTPYGVNSHRLLVRGHRVPYTEAIEAEAPAGIQALSFYTSYLLWVVVGLSLTGLVIGLLYLFERRRRKGKRDRQLQKRHEICQNKQIN